MYIPPKTYIAGPFFNQPQIELIQNIELILTDNGIPIVSPRLQKDNAPEKAGGITPEMARRIFERNIEDMRSCQLMIAVLDWKMPPGNAVRIVSREGLDDGSAITGESPPLNIPDSGTIFEMGFAYGDSQHREYPILIAGFTERDPRSALNVMLTQSCLGVINGLDALKAFTKDSRTNWACAPQWKGRNQ